METEIYIAADDPVRLVSAVVERMDIRKIERSYSQEGRNEYPPRILLKVMIYAYMRLIYSSREIERACRENICFMYLLEDNPARITIQLRGSVHNICRNAKKTCWSSL